MKKRMIGYAAWVLLAACLYFFENNTGTRIVLAGSLLLPLIPFFRREQPAPPGEKKQRAAGQTVGSFLTAEQEDRGDVRAYLPGDPVNRIHWKLSAKRDELLIREQEEVSAEEPVRGTTELPAVPDRRRKRMMLSGIPVILSAVLLLALLPSARMGMQALCNRLFDASEAVNAYAYDRFAVPADQPALFAGILLAVIPAAAVGMTLLSGRRWPAPVLLAGCVLFQVYFGLSFPAWINIGLFASAALWMLRPLTRKTLLSLAAGAALLSLAVTFFWPGTDAATEAASERVRDSLSRMAGLSRTGKPKPGIRIPCPWRTGIGKPERAGNTGWKRWKRNRFPCLTGSAG